MKLRFLRSALLNDIVIGVAAVGTVYVILGYYNGGVAGYVIGGVVAALALAAMVLKGYGVYCDLADREAAKEKQAAAEEQRAAAEAERAATEGRFLQHARGLFEALADEDKAALERIVAAGSVPAASVPDHDRLAATGFVAADSVLARFSLRPEYAPIVARLVREWRAASP